MPVDRRLRSAVDDRTSIYQEIEEFPLNFLLVFVCALFQAIRLRLRRSARQGGTMALITLRQLLDHAAEHNYGVPAFNIYNMEQALAIGDAASALDAPVIIQASRGARPYANDILLRNMMDALTEIYPQIPICVHLD